MTDNIHQEMNEHEYQEYLKLEQNVPQELANSLGKQLKLDAAELILERCRRALGDVVFFHGIYGDEMITKDIMQKRIKILIHQINLLKGKE